MTIPAINIHDHRNGTRGRDLAILDLLHLQQLGLAPGAAPVRLLQKIWGVSQAQVSRRMAAVANLGYYRVESNYGRYLLVEPTRHREARRLDQRTRAERWEAVRKQLREVVG